MSSGAVPLDRIVELRTEKVVVKKDQSRRYIGLEHLGSGYSGIQGWSDARDSISVNSVFESGDILFGKLRPNLQKCEQANFPGYCSTDILVLRARAGVAAGFATRMLQSEQVLAEAVRSAEGTRMPRTSWSRLRELKVAWIPLSEQHRIAEILDMADDAVRSTERLIAKLEQAKRGLLDAEFNKSRDIHSPKCRPLGELLGHLIDFRGRTPRKLGMEWGGGDILALSANNVQMGRVDTSREAYYGSNSLYQAWMTHGHTRRADVLITLEAPLGNIAQIPDGKRYILSQRVVLLRFAESRVLNDFAYWYMQSSAFQGALVRNSTGTTATGIRRAMLERIAFPVPDVGTQARLARSAFAIQSRIHSEVALAEKLKRVRQGLMDDLLTGRVRVSAGEGASM
jgi:type I restriction enzyme S subunit